MPKVGKKKFAYTKAGKKAAKKYAKKVGKKVTKKKKKVKFSQKIRGLKKSECADVKVAIKNKSASKLGISSDKCQVKAGNGGICNSRMLRRILTEASGEQE